MARLPSSRRVVNTLLKFGFEKISQKGSHGKYKLFEDNTVRTVIVPMSKTEIPMGTFHSIIRQSGLEKSDFNNNK